MEDKKLHPVTELLLARMKSHPEEFKDEHLMSELSPTTGYERWYPALRAIKNNGSEQDLEAINEALGAIRMEQVHEWVLDELLNGEERRRNADEKEKQLLHGITSGRGALSNVYNSTQNALNQYQQQYQNALTQIGIGTQTPSQGLNVSNETLEGLHEGTLKQIKRKLGL